jgi:hypothetical protein
MAKRKITANEFFGPRGPLAHLEALSKQIPEASAATMDAIADEVVKIAKEFVSGERVNPDWHPLWLVDQQLYMWTPEFNLKERDTNRSSAQPLLDTGDLHDSIENLGMTTTSRGRASSRVGVEGDNAEKAWFHEGNGNANESGINHLGKVVPRRPFLKPAVVFVKEDEFMTQYFEEVFAEAMERYKKS